MGAPQFINHTLKKLDKHIFCFSSVELLCTFVSFLLVFLRVTSSPFSTPTCPDAREKQLENKEKYATNSLKLTKSRASKESKLLALILCIFPPSFVCFNLPVSQELEEPFQVLANAPLQLLSPVQQSTELSRNVFLGLPAWFRWCLNVCCFRSFSLSWGL